jgi:hypothetical protein
LEPSGDKEEPAGAFIIRNRVWEPQPMMADDSMRLAARSASTGNCHTWQLGH